MNSLLRLYLSIYCSLKVTMSIIAQITQLGRFVREESGVIWLCASLLFITYLLLPRPTYQTNVKVPTIKFFGSWLPKFISRLFFNAHAPFVIYDGYSKVGAGFIF